MGFHIQILRRLHVPMTLQQWSKLVSTDILFIHHPIHDSSHNSINYSECAAMDQNLPPEYIKILPHPHSHDPTVRIIPLSTSSKDTPAFEPKPSASPWAPFENLADFEYTETAVKGLLSKELVNTQLAKMNSTWAVGSTLSIKSHRDMEAVLSKARKYVVQVCNCIYLSALPHYYVSLVLIHKPNISLKVNLSQPRMKASVIKSHLSIEILGNGSWRSYKMSPWPRGICGMLSKSFTVTTIMKNESMMNQTQPMFGGKLM
jgi:hypothetical protein